MPGLAPLVAVLSAVMTLSHVGVPPVRAASASAALLRCTAADFESARSNNTVFVAWFYAPWCPTCLRQQQTLRELMAAGLASSPTVCQFDFDREETLRQRLGVANQSTLVRFRDGTETSRSEGETKPDRLRAFLEGP